jgi:hypothetical protein
MSSAASQVPCGLTWVNGVVGIHQVAVVVEGGLFGWSRPGWLAKGITVWLNRIRAVAWWAGCAVEGLLSGNRCSGRCLDPQLVLRTKLLDSGCWLNVCRHRGCLWRAGRRPGRWAVSGRSYPLQFPA